MNPSSYATMLWCMGQFGFRFRTTFISGRPFDSFLQQVMEHTSTQYGDMTVEQLISATTGLMIYRHVSF